MTKSLIEWTDETWNPITGCTKVSTGCKHCYAERLWQRLSAKNMPYEGRPFTDVQCHPERLSQPLHWKKPRRVFVNSMSDLFHESVRDDFIISVLMVIETAKQHTFQVLTKRPERMRDFFCGESGAGLNVPPIKNLWLGVSVENQETADERIPLLLQTPAAVRFVSAEPLLSPINMVWVSHGLLDKRYYNILDWVIVGGESGPSARPMNPDWARSIRDQCQAAGVPFFMKQMGGKGKKSMPRIPDDLLIRQHPQTEVTPQ